MKRWIALGSALAVGLLVATFAVGGHRGHPRQRRAQPLPPQPREEPGPEASPVSQSSPSPAAEQPAEGGVRPVVENLAFGDGRAKLVGILDSFRARVRSSQTSSSHLTDPEGHFHPLHGLLQGQEGYSILMGDEKRLAGKAWDLLTRLETLLNNETISERDKLTIARNFLGALGLSSDDALSFATLPEVYGMLLEQRAALVEARELRNLLGADFSEAQAREYVLAFRGWGRGQDRLTAFRAVEHQYTDLNDEERRLVRAEIDRLTSEKRERLRLLLTAEQFRRLYDDLHYDADGYWTARVAR